MNPAEEMAGPTERRSASAAAGSDDKIEGQLRVAFEEFQRISDQSTPAEDLHGFKRRASRGFSRYLLAICIGVAAIFTWQSYGDASKQVIANWVEHIGAGSERQAAPVAQTAPTAPSTDLGQVQQMAPTVDLGQVQQMTRDLATLRQTADHLADGQDQVTREIRQLGSAILAKITPTPAPPPPPAAPSLDPEQVHQDLGALRQTIEQLAADQGQMAREIARLESAVAELIVKIPEPPAHPTVAPTPKPTPTPVLGSSRAPIAPPPSRTPTPSLSSRTPTPPRQ